jgi:hypothetical protein
VDKAMPTLMSAFNFTPADLDANQHGFMTKEQRARLRQKRWEKIVPYGFIVGVFALVVGCSLTAIPNLEFSLAGRVVSILCIMLAGMVIPLISFWRQWQRIKLDLDKGDVNIRKGPVLLDIIGGREYKGSVSYKLHMGDIWFDISKEQLLALKHGERYQVFYSPNSKVLLSVEPA